jgi:hypothetical protein
LRRVLKTRNKKKNGAKISYLPIFHEIS